MSRRQPELADTSWQAGAQALAAYYATCSTEQVAGAYRVVAKGLAVFEETPRGNLAAALRGHLDVIVAEQQKRGEVIV